MSRDQFLAALKTISGLSVAQHSRAVLMFDDMAGMDVSVAFAMILADLVKHKEREEYRAEFDRVWPEGKPV